MNKLYRFQQTDFDRLKGEQSTLVAWDMGLGKSVLGVKMDDYHRQNTPTTGTNGKTLVVCPMTVFSTWEEHYAEWAPHLKVHVINPKNRNGFLDVEANVYVLHYEILRRMPQLEQQTWFHVIADEAHRAKNRKALQTRALKRIKAAYKTALTGTPMINRPDDMWSILHWIKPKEFSSYWKFYNRYVDYEVDPRGFHVIKGPRNEAELKLRIAPFYTRRKKGDADVDVDLPPKYYAKPIWVDMVPEQRRAYDEMRKDMIAWIGANKDQPIVSPVVVSKLMRLQQLSLAYAEIVDGKVRLMAPSAKLDALEDLVDASNGNPLVVWTNFKDVVGLVRDRLEAAGKRVAVITGDTGKDARKQITAGFQRGEYDVFVGTIAAAGIGINLYRASTVVFLDRNWSPALNQQAEDRCHRIGQTNPVEIIDIMARDSCDLGKDTKLQLKWQWIRRVVDP